MLRAQVEKVGLPEFESMLICWVLFEIYFVDLPEYSQAKMSRMGSWASKDQGRSSELTIKEAEWQRRLGLDWNAV